MAVIASPTRKIDIWDYGFSIIQIETKAACNMQCEFCAYPLRSDIGTVLDDRVVYAVLNSVKKGRGFEYVCFSQFNEPLMDGRIYDFIIYAKGLGLPVSLVTNGLMLKSEKVVDKLINASPDHVKISLQVANQDLFCKSRKVNIHFDEYKLRIFNYLKKVKNSSTIVSVDIACNFLDKRGPVKAFLLGADRGDSSVYNSIKDLKSDTKKFLKDWEVYSCDYKYIDEDFECFLNNLNIFYIKQNAYPMAKNIFLKIKHFMCGRKLKEFYPVSITKGCSNRILGILATGNVAPCCLIYDNSIKMGNINRQGLGTILERNTEFLKKLRNGEGMPIVCKRCTGAPTKRGVFLKNIRNIVVRGTNYIKIHAN